MNISKEKNIYKFNFNNPLAMTINNISLEDIIKSKQENKFLKNITIAFYKNILVSNNYGKYLAVIFMEPIKVKINDVLYKGNYINLELNGVRSTLEIDIILKVYDIKNANFISFTGELEDYFKSGYELYQYKYDEITIICPYKNYKLPELEIIELKNPIYKYSLSKYFDDYFNYPKEMEFEYYSSRNRDFLRANLENLLKDEKITKFKIAGPSGEGKSISLIYFSRLYYNIIYLNIKKIYKLYNEKKINEYLEMIIYEFHRIKYKEYPEENKKRFEKIFNENSDETPWELLEILINYVKYKNVTIIFDQYKEKYTSDNFLKNIEKYLNKFLRIVVCSSINDKDIGKSVAISLYKNKGQYYLTEDNQNDYFYVSKLFDQSIFRDKYTIEDTTLNNMCKLFNYDPKYVKLITEDKKSLDDIESHIVDKMKEQSSNLGYEFNVYIFNIYSKIGNIMEYDILSLMSISLKYLILNLDKNTFTIDYKYPFIKKIIEKNMKNVDAKEYFNKKKYLDNDLYLNLKGNYFEYAAINYLEKVKNNFFKENIDYTLYVETIVDMNDNIKDSINENYNIKKEKKIITVKDSLERKLNRIKSISNDIKLDENIYNIDYYFYKDLEKEKNEIEKIFLGKKRENENKDKKEKEKQNDNKQNKKTKKEKDVVNEIDLDKNIDYLIYDDDFQNSNILIKQIHFNGKELDLGALFGPKDNKQFIGFQMKFYGEKSHLTSPITKNSIKENIHPILINCLKRFDIKITSWHYIMCLYYNPEDENQYSYTLVNNCKNYGLQYIFYNPSEDKIYDKNFEILNELEMDFRSNIDFTSKVNPYNYFIDTNFLEDYFKQTQNISDISVEKDIFGNNIKELIKKIEQVIGFKAQPLCRFKLVGKSNFPIPKKNYLLAFKSKNSIICYYNIKTIYV